jgi:carboxypeptidase C (cathepsin A)
LRFAGGRTTVPYSRQGSRTFLPATYPFYLGEEARSKHLHLRVLVLIDQCDLACPVDGIRYNFEHLNLDPATRDYITYAAYEAGHMMYVNLPDLRKMQKDLEQFIR